MAFIRNIQTNRAVVTLFGGQVSLEYGETVQISAGRLASTEVQNAISAGSIKEVPSLYYQDPVIKGDWDMANSTAIPPGSQPGFIYSVISAAVHPSTGDSFEAGDLAIIMSNGTSVRNITSTASSSGGGSNEDYVWLTISGQFTPNDKQYLAVDSRTSSFNIILPASPDVGFSTGIVPVYESLETNPITVLRNGNNIQGSAEDMTMNENFPVLLTFVGGSLGWLVSPFTDTSIVMKDLQADSFYTIKPVTGTSYTPIASDSGKIVVFDTTDPVSINLPENSTYPLNPGFNLSFRNKQGGPITLVTSGTDELVGIGDTTVNSASLNSFYLETPASSNIWVAVGDYE